MKPWIEVDRTVTPRGGVLSLSRRDDEWAILLDRKVLMSSRLHSSEEALAPLGCDHCRTLLTPRVLVGGLGMGFTLRATLDILPRKAEVVVSELLESVVTWNRGPIAALSGNALRDPRVKVRLGDVATLVRESDAAFDAILLDIDNAPDAFTLPDNAWLYGLDGLRALKRALRPEGTLAVWSAQPDLRFEKRLRQTDWVGPESKARERVLIRAVPLTSSSSHGRRSLRAGVTEWPLRGCRSLCARAIRQPSRARRLA